MDLLIAATALANDLPLFTQNAGDFEGLAPTSASWLSQLVDVLAAAAAGR